MTNPENAPSDPPQVPQPGDPDYPNPSGQPGPSGTPAEGGGEPAPSVAPDAEPNETDLPDKPAVDLPDDDSAEVPGDEPVPEEDFQDPGVASEDPETDNAEQDAEDDGERYDGGDIPA